MDVPFRGHEFVNMRSNEGATSSAMKITPSSEPGIDMRSPQPIHDAVAHVGRLIDELERSFD